jgi:hypothetical protein
MNTSENQFAYPVFPDAEQRQAWEAQALASLRKYERHLLKSPSVVSYCMTRLCEEDMQGPGDLPVEEAVAACTKALYERLLDRVYGDYYLYALPSAFRKRAKHPRNLIMESYEQIQDLTDRAAALEKDLTDLQIPVTHLARQDTKGALRTLGKVKPGEADERLEQYREEYAEALYTLKSRMKVYRMQNEEAMAEPGHRERAEALLEDYLEGRITLPSDLPPPVTEAFREDLERYRAVTAGAIQSDTPHGKAIIAYVREHLAELVLLAAEGKLRLKTLLVSPARDARRILSMASEYTRPSAEEGLTEDGGVDQKNYKLEEDE